MTKRGKSVKGRVILQHNFDDNSTLHSFLRNAPTPRNLFICIERGHYEQVGLLRPDLKRILVTNISDFQGIERDYQVDPPKFAQFVLLMLPAKHREHLLGDLEEEFTTVVLPEYGPTRARLWYWWHAAISIAPFAWRGLKKVAGATLVLKLIGGK